MKTGPKPLVVLVTAPNIQVARKLAGAALRERFIACANIVPRIESHYWWQGKMERASEVLLIMKTTSGKAAALEKLIISLHPYDTPEFVVLSVERANRKYLRWWLDSMQPSEE